jgi:hypothetical protein
MVLSLLMMDHRYGFGRRDNAPLREQYLVLYNIVRHKSDTIAVIIATSPPDVSFRRDLIGLRLTVWNPLLLHLATMRLSPGPDEFRWSLYVNGTFSVDSLYKAIIQSDISVDNNKKK